MKKKTKRIFDIFIYSIIAIIILLYLIGFISIGICMFLEGIWVGVMLITCAIVGLLTNSILLSRGGDLEYKPSSILGIIGNIVILIIGIFVLVLTLLE